MAYQWGWMIQDPKNQFLIETFATSESECLDKFASRYASTLDENTSFLEPFTWMAKKKKEGFEPVEITINNAVKPPRKGTDHD